MFLKTHKKVDKLLKERENFINGLDLEELKNEPFVMEITDKIPMRLQIEILGKVVSGMYKVGDPIGIKVGDEIIHSKDYFFKFYKGIPTEYIEEIYKGEEVFVIFNDIYAKLVDDDAVVYAEPYNKIHNE